MIVISRRSIALMGWYSWYTTPHRPLDFGVGRGFESHP
jgi:hypothetical protein